MKIALSTLIILFVLSFVNKINANEKDKRVNILFAISDDQSFKHTGFEGCKFVNTPAFDKIASEGIYFKNCFAGSPGCAPSRSTIVTGRYHWQNEQSGQHASSWMKKYVPFIDLLDANGYITGRTGKGVSPFKYAKDENDSLFRATNAGGILHSNFKYKKKYGKDERTATGIQEYNYYKNFKFFMDSVRGDKPFFFWYGCKEPHRSYEQDSWKRNNKKLENVTVPEFYPDNGIIRGDMLDYAVEIDWFDLHLQRMLDYLKEKGELENTIVIVTSDNGMPFPRCKGNSYEYGVRVPFAIRYPKGFPGGRIVNDPLSFADLAPTILELTQTSQEGMLPIAGKSIVNILQSDRQNIVDDTKKFVYAGRERHSSSRYKNWGYPQRVIRSKDHLLIWNMKPERWPSGAPQRIDPKDSTKLLPNYGVDENGKYNQSQAFTDIDAGLTKFFLIENRNDEKVKPFFNLATAKRPEFEFFDIINDEACINDLYADPEYAELVSEMKDALVKELMKSEDTRLVGPDTEIFDSYLRYSGMRYFPKPQ